MKKWLKRIGLAMAALIAIVIAAGAFTEQVARWRAPHEFLVQGKLVNIGTADTDRLPGHWNARRGIRIK